MYTNFLGKQNKIILVFKENLPMNGGVCMERRKIV